MELFVAKFQDGDGVFSADYSVVPGGGDNSVSGDYSLAFGKDVTVTADYVTAFYDDDYPGKLGINEPGPTSTLHYDGSEASAWAEKNADYTLTVSDHTIFVDGNGVTLTLPDPDAGVDNCPGRIYYIKNISETTADSVNVDPPAGSLIEHLGNKYLHAGEGWVIQADAIRWWIISKY